MHKLQPRHTATFTRPYGARLFRRVFQKSALRGGPPSRHLLQVNATACPVSAFRCVPTVRDCLVSLLFSFVDEDIAMV